MAHADPIKLSDTATHNTPPDSKPINTKHTIVLDQKGRWSVRLDMNQPVGRDVQLNDVQAGAFFRLTPTLRVGGAVALGDGALPTDRTNLPQVQAQAPRLKLETNFKF